jgi:hypothetical protein
MTSAGPETNGKRPPRSRTGRCRAGVQLEAGAALGEDEARERIDGYLDRLDGAPRLRAVGE